MTEQDPSRRMGPIPLRSITPNADAEGCAFFAQAEDGARQCLAGQYPLNVTRGHAAAFCHTAHHVECAYYLAARESGRGGEELYDDSPRALEAAGVAASAWRPEEGEHPMHRERRFGLNLPPGVGVPKGALFALGAFALMMAVLYALQTYIGTDVSRFGQRLGGAASLLIPLGILGAVRWSVWLLKRLPASFYRPIENDYDCTATIITPVYGEDPVLFRRALDSWIANGPDRIIAVIDVTETTCEQIVREEYAGRVEIMPINLPGKRPALAAGVDASTTDIVVLVDSDVIWERDVLKKIKMPFKDPKIGGVGTRQNMYPTDGVKPTIWERMADIFLDIRYTDEVPATTVLGRAVSCLSGRTAAYRTELLQGLREPFLNETFNGKPCMSGDDKRYTTLVLQSGYKTWNQLNARVYSTFKPDFLGFRKQRIRWSRNSYRSDLRALWQGWVWRHPYLALMLVDKTVAPFTLLVGPIVLVVSLIVGDWPLVAALLVWWHVSRAIKIYPHMKRRPQDWVLLPLFLGMTYYMSLVKGYALFTINEHKWLTRAVAMVDGQAVRVSEAEQDGTAAAA